VEENQGQIHSCHLEQVEARLKGQDQRSSGLKLFAVAAEVVLEFEGVLGVAVVDLVLDKGPLQRGDHEGVIGEVGEVVVHGRVLSQGMASFAVLVLDSVLVVEAE